MKKFYWMAVMVLVLIGAGCAKQSTSTPGISDAPYKNISAQEFKGVLDSQKKDFLLVDVHIPEQRHIAGTDLFVPYNEIDRNQAKFPKDKDMKIVLYCRSGSMSQEAAFTLADLGYTNLYNLDGGIYAWEAAGYSVE